MRYRIASIAAAIASCAFGVAVGWTGAGGADVTGMLPLDVAPRLRVALTGSAGGDELDAAARAAASWFVPLAGQDPAFVSAIAESLEVGRRAGWGRIAAARPADVGTLRRDVGVAGLPDVIVGVPFVESRLDARVTSRHCAAGTWQLLPEVAVDLGLRVQGCTLDDGSVFTPGRRLPSPEDRRYLVGGSCAIDRCDVDERRDDRRARSAALTLLGTAWDDPVLAAHPQRAVLAVLSYNAGLGATQRWLAHTEDPIASLGACAAGKGCDGMSTEAGKFVPMVIAASAIAACHAASPDVATLSDWSRSAMCGALADAGLAPAPSTASDVLRAAAGRTARPVGLLAATPGESTDFARALDARLLSALGRAGFGVVPGVPGESADDLRAQGADRVLRVTTGRIGDRTWVEVGVDGGAPGFVLLEAPGAMPDVEALLADALVRPVHDRRSAMVLALVEAEHRQLGACLGHQGGVLATLALGVDPEGRAVPVDVGGAADAATTACLVGALDGIDFPRDLAGTGVVLDVSWDAPIADAEAATDRGGDDVDGPR